MMETKSVEEQELFVIVGSVWELTKGAGSADYDAPAKGYWDPKPDEDSGIIPVVFS